MSTRFAALRPGLLARQGTAASLGVGCGATAAAVVVTTLESFDDGGPWDAFVACLRFAASTALPCALIVWPLAAVRLRRTRLRAVRERCSSVAVWSCVVPFVWAVGFAVEVARLGNGPPPRGVVGLAVIAGGVAEMVWLLTLTPVFIYHCTARALRGDPFNGASRSRGGRDERDEDAEVGWAPKRCAGR